MVAFTLVVVGALNWGLVGLLGFNLVETILGVGTTLTKVVYVLVGVSAVWVGATHKKDCRICGKA
jgi:uncharacterized membrane protein YuzA (DUF378 family)